MEWHKEVQNDMNNWSTEVFTEYPYIIAHEYYRLYNMIGAGEIYGCIFQLKDVLEVAIKFPILLAAAITDSAGNYDILKALTSKELSLGDWVNTIAPKVNKSTELNDKFGRDLKILVKNIQQFFNRNNLIAWRNDTVGHGALGFAEDEDFKADLTSKILIIKDLFISEGDKYKSLKIVQNEIELVGHYLIVDVDTPLLLDTGSGLINLKHYFTAAPLNGMNLFDSINRGQETKTINYITGKRTKCSDDYFLQAYKQYHSNVPVIYHDSIEETVYLKRVDDIINSLNDTNKYVKAKYLEDWLNTRIDTKNKGVFLLCTERGTGKTAFSRAINDLSKNQIPINNTTVRTYHINRVTLRSVGDFISSINHLFREMKNSDDNIRTLEDNALPRISIHDEQYNQSLATLLNEYRKIHQHHFGKEKLLLVIDGIDELSSRDINVLSFIPNKNLLDDDVYILLTCRSDIALPLSVLEFIQYFPFDAAGTFDRNLQNKQLLKQYVIEKMSYCGRGLTDIEVEKVLDFLDNRFLSASMVQELLKGSSALTIYQLCESTSIESYLMLLQKRYGEKIFNSFLDILLTLASAFEPLTIKEIVRLNNRSDITLQDIAFINDVQSIIHIERSYRGNLLFIENNGFRDYILNKYAHDLQSKAEALVTFVNEIVSITKIDMDNFSYIYAYVWDYHEKYTADSRVLTSITAERMLNFAYIYEKAHHGAHALKRITYMYTGATYIWQKLFNDPIKGNDYKLYCATANLNLINTYYTIKQFPSAFESARLAFELIDELPKDIQDTQKCKDLQLRINTRIMICYGELRDIASFEKHYNAAKKLAIELGDNSILDSIETNYLIFYKHTNPEYVIDKMQQIIKEIEQYPGFDIFQLANKYIILGNAFSGNGQSPLALKSYDKALEMMHPSCFRKLYDHQICINALKFRGQLYTHQIPDYDKAIEDLDAALYYLYRLESNGTVIDVFERARIMTSFAWALSKRNTGNDMDSAVKMINEAESIWNQLIGDGITIDIQSRSVTTMNKGIILHRAGKTSDGILTLKSALTWLDSGDEYQRKQIVNIHLRAADIYQQVGDSENAIYEKNEAEKYGGVDVL